MCLNFALKKKKKRSSLGNNADAGIQNRALVYFEKLDTPSTNIHQEFNSNLLALLPDFASTGTAAKTNTCLYFKDVERNLQFEQINGIISNIELPRVFLLFYVDVFQT